MSRNPTMRVEGWGAFGLSAGRAPVLYGPRSTCWPESLVIMGVLAGYRYVALFLVGRTIARTLFWTPVRSFDSGGLVVLKTC